MIMLVLGYEVICKEISVVSLVFYISNLDPIRRFKLFKLIHRLWSHFESGGGERIMRVKRGRARIAAEKGEGVGGGIPLRRCRKIFKK